MAQNKCRPPQKAIRPTIQPLKPIIGPPSPSHSQTSSPAMSRRSSSSGSTTSSITGKCVHFPCNPAKMATKFLTHSREVYDRSPIIPSGEDLDIPSCKGSEEGSWIKCLQRQAKEAAKEGQAPPHTSLMRSSTEAPDSDSYEPALTSPLSDVSLPSLTQDDYSSCSESDELGPLSASHSAFNFASLNAHCRSPSLEMYLQLSVKEQDSWQGDIDTVEDDCEEEEEPAVEVSDTTQHHERKLGMCALGKFSRKSLFENDAFGGF